MKRLSGITCLVLLGWVVGCQHTKQPVQLTQAQFMEAYRAKHIYNGHLSPDPVSPAVQKVTGVLRKPNSEEEVFFVSYIVVSGQLKEELLASGRFETGGPRRAFTW